MIFDGYMIYGEQFTDSYQFIICSIGFSAESNFLTRDAVNGHHEERNDKRKSIERIANCAAIDAHTRNPDVGLFDPPFCFSFEPPYDRKVSLDGKTSKTFKPDEEWQDRFLQAFVEAYRSLTSGNKLTI